MKILNVFIFFVNYYSAVSIRATSK